MRVLALDSAFGGLSVALAEGPVTLVAMNGDPSLKAAESLPGMVDWALKRASWPLEDVDRIAVTLGPGGFTSLRAGLAFAKGLAMGASKPLLGFTTLEALAASLPLTDTPIVSIIDAKRDEVFLQVFDYNVSALSDPAVCPVSQLSSAFDWPDEFRVCGSGSQILCDLIGPSAKDAGVYAPEASALALHCQKFSPQDRPAQAVYLRPADARPMA